MTSTAPKTRTVKFETAVTRGLAAIKTQTKTQWTVGDLALTIDTTVYGSGTVQRFSDEIGMPYKTVMDLRKVASRYDASERSELNSHSIHQIFAGQDDRAELVKSQRWTASAARDLIKSRKGDDSNAGDGDNDSDNGDNAGATDSDPRVKLVANVERLTAELAKATAALAAYDAEHSTPATAPKATAPKATAPKATAPKATAPKATAPKATAPKATAPKATAPKATAPKATAPKATAPKATAPKATAPKATAPKATAPKATAPKATAPKADRHVVKGIPAHDATDARTDCPRCTTAAQLTIPS